MHSFSHKKSKTCFNEIIVLFFLIFVQVRTLLENPTRYHVVQKQKNQVRQYLHESFRSGDSDGTNGIVSGSIGSEIGSGGTSSVDTGPPMSQVQPMVVQSAPPGPAVHQPKPQHPHLSSYPHVPSLLGRVTGVASASPDPISGAMSPGLSSVATSNSEVSNYLWRCCRLIKLPYHVN